MAFDDFLIKIMLESIITPMAFMKWYFIQHEDKTIGISEEKLERLNRWEKIVTPIRYADRQEDYAELQHELMIKTGLYLEKI